MPRFPRSLLCLVPLLLAGCGRSEAMTDMPAPVAAPDAKAGTHFDSKTVGSIRGQVTWEGGDPPIVRPFHAPVSPLCEQEPHGPKRDWPNPHAPQINLETKGIGGAVVFLRGIDPKRGRPWDYPPVKVEVKDYQFHVRQGQSDGHTAFVQRGAAVEFVNLQKEFQSIQARGDAFFALPFPDANLPRKRTLDRSGIVELLSGNGHFWARGYLFVSDHPYFTRSHADGTFTLSDVPPGDYELVCWLPNWNTVGHELDADTWEVTRVTYRAPVMRKQSIRIQAGSLRPTWFRFAAPDF